MPPANVSRQSRGRTLRSHHAAGGPPDTSTLAHDRLTAQEHVPHRKAELLCIERAVLLARFHESGGHQRAPVRVDDHDVGVETGSNGALRLLNTGEGGWRLPQPS